VAVIIDTSDDDNNDTDNIVETSDELVMQLKHRILLMLLISYALYWGLKIP